MVVMYLRARHLSLLTKNSRVDRCLLVSRVGARGGRRRFLRAMRNNTERWTTSRVYLFIFHSKLRLSAPRPHSEVDPLLVAALVHRAYPMHDILTPGAYGAPGSEASKKYQY